MKRPRWRRFGIIVGLSAMVLLPFMIHPAGFNEIHTAYILAHEIGHVFGFMHTDADNHLMNGPGGLVFDHTYEREHAFVIPEPGSLHD